MEGGWATPKIVHKNTMTAILHVPSAELSAVIRIADQFKIERAKYV